MSIKLLFTWKPPRGLDRIQKAVDGLEIQALDDPAEILKLIPGFFIALACVSRLSGRASPSGGSANVLELESSGGYVVIRLGAAPAWRYRRGETLWCFLKTREK